jgi:serine carboxypeptidase-like clade 2
MLKVTAFVAVFALAVASSAAAGSFGKDTPAAEADRIKSLPGLSPFPTDYSMYSGYVTVNAASQRRLFYWMVTSKAGLGFRV